MCIAFVLFILLSFAVSLGWAVVIGAAEQYVTVLTSRQFVPSPVIDSPFFGILYVTVTPMEATQTRTPRFRIETLLFHNIIYASSAGIYGPSERGRAGTSRLLELNNELATPGVVPVGPVHFQSITGFELVSLLRQGLLFASITSGGASAGQIRGQIESRNDVFLALLKDPNFDPLITGVAVIRAVVSKGIISAAFYILTTTRAETDFVGISPAITRGVVIDFGVVKNAVAGMHSAYARGIQIPLRGFVPKVWPVFGPNSTHMNIYSQDLTITNGTLARLGSFMRMPLFMFKENTAFLYNFTV